MTAITVTTLRKAGTLAASFALFPKPLGLGHPIGAALVLCSAFVKAGIGCRCLGIVQVPLLAAAHVGAASLQKGPPPACPGPPSGLESRALACWLLEWGSTDALAPAQSSRACPLPLPPRCRREGVPSSSSAEGELDDLLPKSHGSNAGGSGTTRCACASV